MKTKPTAATSMTPDLVTDVTPTSIITTPMGTPDATATATADPAGQAPSQLMDSYIKLGASAWQYYGSLLDQTGFQWAAWWFKWEPEERLAQQMSAPVPGMSTAFELGKTFYDTAADMQARWFDAWQRFFTWQPFESRLHGDTGGALQAAATVE